MGRSRRCGATFTLSKGAKRPRRRGGRGSGRGSCRRYDLGRLSRSPCAIVGAMPRPITGIDHAIIGVRRLDSAAEVYRKLGFTLSPRGRHYGWGTANYCIMFAQDYIELLGIVDPAGFTNNLD